MAIFGAGSIWDDEDIVNDFFANEDFVIGWDYDKGKDLYEIAALLKAGDIIYLKSNRPGTRDVRIKGIGVVKATVIHSIFAHGSFISPLLKVPVKWIVKSEFRIIIPPNEGKLTNIRAATMYEEHLPYVQQKILEALYKTNFNMDYQIGQLITGIISVALQSLQLWQQTRNVSEVRKTVQQFDQITQSPEVVEEGNTLQQLLPQETLSILKDRLQQCWTDFNEVARDLDTLPDAMDRFTNGLQRCICRELKRIKKLNDELPTRKMQQWWDTYDCEVSR